MADESSEQNRSEPATPFKLDEARKKGSVPRSTEVNAATALMIALIASTAFTDWGLQRLILLEKQLFISSGRWTFETSSLMARFRYLGESALFILSPLLAMLVMGAVLSNLFQTGPVFSTHPLTPDISRLNPATGLKRLFSVRSLFEGLKGVLKLSVVILVAYFALKALVPSLPSLYQMPVRNLPTLFRQYSLRLLGDLMIAVVAIAVVDLAFTRWEFAKRMRMSTREVKEEVKRREGDPKIRRRRREIQREMRKRSLAVQKVKDSDVLITNPEHFAVALQYRRDSRPAPEVIAKGAGDLALHMREAAFKTGVPIVPSPKLARDLFQNIPLGAMVETRHYEIVASILKSTYAQKRRKAERVPA